jgi:cytochrome c oxidase subunit 2
LVVALLMLACDADARQSTFGTAGPVAEKQLLLFNVLLWVMVVVFILVEGALVYAAIKFRRRPGQGLPKQVHGHTALEITWTVIPTILILALGGWSVITLFELEKPPVSADNPILEITVTGHQWWWEFEYPDADGNGKHVVTGNELRVPVGRAVRINLESDDVLHSFWVPKLAGKVDVVPTRQNKMWFKADETGTFYGQCAEFCGTAHALMKFRVEVLTEDAYNAWVAGYGQPPQLSPEAQQGQQVFNGAGGCILCHTTTGAAGPDPAVLTAGFAGGAPTFPGPNLTDLATRQTFAAGLRDLNRLNLREWLRNPNDIKPGNHMASLATVYQTADGDISLQPGEVDALIEYLLSLK